VITEHQYRRLMRTYRNNGGVVSHAAMKAGMDRTTAAQYLRLKRAPSGDDSLEILRSLGFARLHTSVRNSPTCSLGHERRLRPGGGNDDSAPLPWDADHRAPYRIRMVNVSPKDNGGA
jgi:hypothetical protein